MDSVFPADLLRVHERIRREPRAVEVGCVELHAGDLAVVVGRVVINALIRVAAAGIERDLKLTVVQLTAAALLDVLIPVLATCTPLPKPRKKKVKA